MCHVSLLAYVVIGLERGMTGLEAIPSVRVRSQTGQTRRHVATLPLARGRQHGEHFSASGHQTADRQPLHMRSRTSYQCHQVALASRDASGLGLGRPLLNVGDVPFSHQVLEDVVDGGTGPWLQRNLGCCLGVRTFPPPREHRRAEGRGRLHFMTNGAVRTPQRRQCASMSAGSPRESQTGRP
jgi:hypothetical protein